MPKFYIALLMLVVTTMSVRAQISINNLNQPYGENFNSLAAAGTANEVSTLPAGWTFLETGTNANSTYAAGTGSSNTGNTYSFGLDVSDRSLGGLLSGSLTPFIGASFVNNTGSAITTVNIAYTGEQWRLGATGRTDRIDFQYSLDASSLNSGTWTDIDALDFNSPVTTGTLGALNGNDNANRIVITASITGLTLEPGAVIFIRWTDFNAAGADDGLSVDDFSIEAEGIPNNLPSISFSPASLAFGDVTLGETKILSYQVTGENLEDSISITTTSGVFSISTDSVNFSTQAVLPAGGGKVYVRFTPSVNGSYDDSAFHASTGISKTFLLEGNGYDPASNIISIASARSGSVGTKVTVAGRITVSDQLGNPAYVQDCTGGIPVFDFTLSNATEIGDSVIVTGPIGVFNDQKQISGTGISFIVIDVPVREVEPKVITLSQLAANEGLLVTVQNITLVNNDFVFYPQSTERMTDGITQADLRIDGDTDIPGLTKPQGMVDITGVVGRFRTNAQLLPRSRADVPGAEEPSTPADTIPASLTFDVVNWNLEFFGATREQYGEEFGPEDEALQLQNIKAVLDTLNADVVAVQEVSDDSLFAALVSQMPHHAFLCSDRYSYSFDSTSTDFPPQKVCFIYDTTTVDVVSARPLFENLYDSARLIDPSLLPGYPGGIPSSFYSSGRLPYLFTANITIEGVNERISFINIHAKSGSAANDRARREYDARVLKDSIDTYFSNDHLIILGDLNDDLDQSISAGAASPYQAFVDDTLNYAAISKTLSDAGARTTVSFMDVIDHQILTNNLNEEYLVGSVQVITPFRLIANYANTTSDHLPVRSRYRFHAPEIFFVTTDTIVSEDTTSFVAEMHFSQPLTTEKQIVIATGGSAVINADLSTTPATSDNIVITAPAGSTSASFTITVVEDAIDEVDEQALFTIQPTKGIAVGVPSTFSVTIVDNDIPTIAFVERYGSASEGADPFAVKLKLSTALASEQSVTIQTLKLPWVVYGQDYTTDPATDGNMINLSIPAGAEETQFTISPLADRKRELPLEVVSFYLKESTDGIQITSPGYFVFAILDVKPHVAFEAFPNPTTGSVSLRSTGLEPSAVINTELRNSWGEIILIKKGSLDELSEQISRILSHHRKGIYTLTLNAGSERHLIRLMKE